MLSNNGGFTCFKVLLVFQRLRAAAIVLGLALAALTCVAKADTWQGPDLSTVLTPTWNIGVNWMGNAIPPPGDVDNFGLQGDGGVVTLDGNQTAAGLTLQSWVGYDFQPGNNPANTLKLPGNATISIADNIRSTYMSDYFIGPLPTPPAAGAVMTGAPRISADMNITNTLNVLFQSSKPNDSSLLLAGRVANDLTGAVTVSIAGNTKNASLWVTYDSSKFGQKSTHDTITINNMGPSGKVHYVDSGNLGAGYLIINGGTLACHANNAPPNPPGSYVYNNIGVNVTNGAFFADRSYQTNPLNTLSNGKFDFNETGDYFLLDNGVASAQATFTGNNGFDFGIGYGNNGLMIGPGPGNHIITVNNGVKTGGRAGVNVLSMPANGINMSLTTVHDYVGNFQACAYSDNGRTLVKNGLGVLELYIEPRPNGGQSTGMKQIDAGVLRFSAPVDGAPPPQNDTGQVLLNSASSAVGVGYDGNVASIIPLAMSGALNVPGQSGAFDIDYNGGTQTLVEDFTNKAAVRTALRIGSSIDNASINVPGTILPSTDAHTYFLGGGGGTLTINCALNNSGGPTATGLEMGTSGNLLPGHVILAAYENLYSGPTLIHAGTLQLVNVSAVGESSRMSVGTYSTGFNGIYTDAPADYFNGFGTLLLDPAVAYGGPVNAKTLDGGAVGWTAPKTLTALPGVYGATLLSKLANTAGFPAGVPTNILHLGGSGFITKRNWTITDNNGTPVALVKSGSCTLDLSQDGAMGANTYSGGTSILRGGIIVSAANQLGSGPIFLANVGLLRVTAPDSFTQTLKPYGDPLNGAGNGAGVISVDIGVTVQFVGAIDTSLSPQSLIEKQGGGDLAFTANNHYAYDVSKADCWGLMLTEGTVHVNQLPVDTTMENNQTGALVCNGGALIVEPATSSMHVPTDHANYGFSALASFQDTVSNLDVADGALLRITGRGASTLNGSIIVNAASGSIGTMELASDVSGSDTTGNGIIDLRGGTLKLTQLNNDINQTSKLILPQSTGFTLKLNGGTFIGNKDGCINGNLIINDSDPVGASHIQSAGTPLDANKLWVVGGSGLTSWSGTLEKDEPGTVRFDRFKGAPVTVDPTSNLLKITDGTFNAAGLGDPFTDTATGVSIEIQNDSTAAGLLISEGVKVVDNIYGTGNTAVIGPAGTELIVDSIVQNNLTLGADCLVTIRPIPGGHSDSYTSITPVPEPATWLLLVLAAAGLLSWRARRLLYKRGGWSI